MAIFNSYVKLPEGRWRCFPKFGSCEAPAQPAGEERGSTAQSHCLWEGSEINPHLSPAWAGQSLRIQLLWLSEGSPSSVKSAPHQIVNLHSSLMFVGQEQHHYWLIHPWPLPWGPHPGGLCSGNGEWGGGLPIHQRFQELEKESPVAGLNFCWSFLRGVWGGPRGLVEELSTDALGWNPVIPFLNASKLSPGSKPISVWILVEKIMISINHQENLKSDHKKWTDQPQLQDLLGSPEWAQLRSQIDREDSDRLRSEVDELVKQLVDQLTGLENHLLLSWHFLVVSGSFGSSIFIEFPMFWLTLDGLDGMAWLLREIFSWEKKHWRSLEKAPGWREATWAEDIVASLLLFAFAWGWWSAKTSPKDYHF